MKKKEKRLNYSKAHEHAGRHRTRRWHCHLGLIWDLDLYSLPLARRRGEERGMTDLFSRHWLNQHSPCENGFLLTAQVTIVEAEITGVRGGRGVKGWWEICHWGECECFHVYVFVSCWRLYQHMPATHTSRYYPSNPPIPVNNVK